MGSKEVMSLHSQGLAAGAIAKKLKCSRQYVYSTLSLHKLKPHPTATARRVQAAVAAVGNGMGVAAAAKRYELSYPTVYRAAVNAGVYKPRVDRTVKRQFAQVNCRLDQYEDLKAISSQLGISISELMRRFVDLGVKDHYDLKKSAV